MKRFIYYFIPALLIFSNHLHSQWELLIDGVDTRAFAIIDSNIYAAIYLGGVYRSTNNGINWTEANNGLTNWNVSSFALIDSYLFAGTFGGGIYRSSNNGDNWTAINNGITSNWANCLAAKDPYIFAGTNDDGVYRSTNNGVNWYLINNGLGSNQVRALIVKDSILYAGTNSGVFYSSDYGKHWNSLNNDLSQQDIYSLAICGEYLFAGTAGGVYRLSNIDTNWIPVNNGITTTTVRTLSCKTTNIFAGISSGVFLSTNYGITWTKVKSNLSPGSTASLAHNNSFLFAGTLMGGLWRNTLQNVIPPIGFYPNPIEFRNVAVTESSTVSINIINSFDTTFTIDSIYTNTTLFAAHLNGDRILGFDTLIIPISYFPKSIGSFYDTLYIANNSNTRLLKLLLDANSPFPTINISPSPIYFNDVIKDSTKQLHLGVTNTSVNALRIDSLYTKSKNFDVLQLDKNDLIGKKDTALITVRFTPDNYGIFTDTLFVINNSETQTIGVVLNGKGSLTTVESFNNRQQKVYSLYQNYPNPFNPTTIIKYDLPNRSLVRLVIIDMLGREVQTLVLEDQSSGSHSVEFKAQNLSSGMYFYRLHANDFIQTKRLLLIK